MLSLWNRPWLPWCQAKKKKDFASKFLCGLEGLECLALSVSHLHLSLCVQVGESTPVTPPMQPRPFNLYVVAEDCAPPKDNEGIMYIKQGQVFDVIDDSSDWWLARLIRDTSPSSNRICQQGWVPGTFLDRFEGQLSAKEEETALTSENLMS